MARPSPTSHSESPASNQVIRADADPSPSARLVLVESLHMVRAGLAMMIESDPSIELVGEAASADEALQVLRETPKRWLVALVSVALTGTPDAYWLIGTIRREFPQVRILAMGANVDELTLGRALFVGADGFVDKASTVDEFLDAIRRSATGETVMCGVGREQFGAVAEGIQRQAAQPAVLTPRQLDVLAAASQGLTARQIGRRLRLEERTVTTHLSRIYVKLGVTNRVAAIGAAGRAGLIRQPTAE